MLLLLFFLDFQRPGMQLTFTNLQEARGQLYVAVYDSEQDFLQTDKILAKSITAVRQAGSMDIYLPDLKAGKYAVSCFHDLNNNGKLDTNLFGIPTEPYGFSNNARPRFRAPSWKEAKFEWQEGNKVASIRLEKW